ncbi:hypothetical protein GCM10027277_23810 [Pseudoduganella ginsengisoli]|nr:TfoX/Sxy family protein [Pseudoduganella ginsengisoli]
MSEQQSAWQQQFSMVAEALSGEPGVSVGQRGKKGFGSSALQVNGKIFAMVSSADEFVVKLPRKRVDELVAAGSGQQFDPGHGRLMKEWLAVHQAAAKDSLQLAREALHFVGAQR